MEKISIICVDDQQEVLDSVTRDLRSLNSHVRVEEAISAADCLALIDELDAEGTHIALILSDQVMPEQSGVDLLRSINEDRRFTKTRKVLLTGQASHADTIRAVNEGHIDNYIEKPWTAENLLSIVKRLLTLYIMESGLDYQAYMPVLDSTTLLKKLH